MKQNAPGRNSCLSRTVMFSQAACWLVCKRIQIANVCAWLEEIKREGKWVFVHSHSDAIKPNTKHAWWGHGQSRMTGANGSELMLSVEVNFVRLPLHSEYQVWVWHSDGQLHKTHETTRTQEEWFQPWFYFCSFDCPQDIYTRKTKIW